MRDGILNAPKAEEANGVYLSEGICSYKNNLLLPIKTSCPLTRPAENSSWETPSAVSVPGITL